MVAISKTLGPIHFEDLEPKRFEDLVRQLLYDFRPWEILEATGRSGSDDGFDARGFEAASGAVGEPIPGEDNLEDEEPLTKTEERSWLIQCKGSIRLT